MNGFVAEDDGLAVDGNARHATRRRSGGDDDLVGRGEGLPGAIVQRDLDTLLAALQAGEARGALEPLDLVLLEQHLDAAGEARHHLVLAGVHGNHVDADAGAVNAGEAPFPGALRHLQGMRVFEQRLGRDATPDQAGAAERLLLLNDRHLEAQLRRADRRHVTAGPRTHHDHVVFVRHNTLAHRRHFGGGGNPSMSLEIEREVKDALIATRGRKFPGGLAPPAPPDRPWPSVRRGRT